MYTPAYQTYSYRGQLHQVSITYCTMQRYPGQIYPPLIKPTATEANYTRSVSHIAQCRHTHSRHTPHLSNWELQRPTTPGQYHILHNADISRADITPPLIEPRATEADNTKLVSHIRQCRHNINMCNNADIPDRKSYIFWYRMIWVMLLHTQNTSIMQDPQRRQTPLRNRDNRWTTGKWHKSCTQPYINMRTISNADQFTHILPLPISCITTPRYYLQGTGSCTPPPLTHIWWPTTVLCSFHL